MQLDKTRIVIRPRGVWELLDLALGVCREFAKPLLLTNALIIVPVALVNGYVLHQILEDEVSSQTIGRYAWDMLLVVFIQTPLATAATTIVLGRGMFLQPVDRRSILKELRGAILKLLLFVGVFRLALVPWLLFVWFNPDSYESSSQETWLFLVAMYLVFVRGFRPFLNEIVLLERPPWRAKDGRMTLRRRNRTLHKPSGGDLFGRAFILAGASALLFVAIWLSIWYAYGIVTSYWLVGQFMIEFAFPLVLWLLAVFGMVVNFLSYLDLRIRQEGWEVELRIRAAGLEMTKGEVT